MRIHDSVSIINYPGLYFNPLVPELNAWWSYKNESSIRKASKCHHFYLQQGVLSIALHKGCP